MLDDRADRPFVLCKGTREQLVAGASDAGIAVALRRLGNLGHGLRAKDGQFLAGGKLGGPVRARGGPDQVVQGRLHAVGRGQAGLVGGRGRGDRRAYEQGHEGHDRLHFRPSCESVTARINGR